MFTNWRTSLIGAGGAIAMGGGQLITSGVFDWKIYLQMAFMTLLGAFAKDFNVSGAAQK